MKTMKYIWTLCLAVVALGLTGCKDDDNGGSGTQMRIDKVFLENINDEVNKDREVEFARLGQLIRIQGSGFTGLKKIYINGYETYFNNALMTDNNIWVTLNSETPVDKADDDVRNTIILHKSDNNRLVYDFIIRASAPSISSCDNTLPKAGETVTVYGTNLQETTQVTLPDGTVVTEESIVSDEDGKWYSFIVPAAANLSVVGSLTSEGANGTAVTPSFFNDFRNYVTNFDGLGELGSWSATYSPDDLVDDPLNSGRGKVCQIVPPVKLDAGGLDAGSNALMWATAGNDNKADDWTARMYASIPATTSAANVALQFDVYCPEPWDNTGQIEISLQNNLSNYGYGSSGTKYSAEYYNTATVWVPWFNETDGSHAAWTTGERWQTITIPMTKIGKYDPTENPNATFANICEDRNAGSYRNFLIFFVNSDLEDEALGVKYPASLFNQKIYVDNIRVVDITPVSVSDFNDTAE